MVRSDQYTAGISHNAIQREQTLYKQKKKTTKQKQRIEKKT